MQAFGSIKDNSRTFLNYLILKTLGVFYFILSYSKND